MSNEQQTSGSAQRFLRLPDWVDHNKAKGPPFDSLAAVQWFIRRHRAPLFEAGVYIPRMGPGGSLIRDDFTVIALEIMRREAGEKLGAAA